MTNESATIVQHLWNHYNVLRDDGTKELDEALPYEDDMFRAEKVRDSEIRGLSHKAGLRRGWMF